MSAGSLAPAQPYHKYHLPFKRNKSFRKTESHTGEAAFPTREPSILSKKVNPDQKKSF